MSPASPKSSALVALLPRQQVDRLVRGLLADGTYGPGDLLPTAGDIARLCDDVSKPTVRRAIKTLIAEGVLRSVPGKGVYVSARITSRGGHQTRGRGANSQDLSRAPAASSPIKI